MSRRHYGRTDGFGTRLTLRPTKYESMRMKIGVKNSKTICRKIIDVAADTVEDNLSSWLTATRTINKSELVSHIDFRVAPDGTRYYAVTIEEIPE